jgi:Sulfide dehydrogenase [flavocytochrome c] flavoprotein chain, central
MQRLTRRRLVSGLMAGGAVLAAGDLATSLSRQPSRRRILVVGGGPAGISAALAVRAADARAQLLVIERDPQRLRPEAEGNLSFERPNAAEGLRRLQQAGIELALDEIEDIDWRQMRARTFSGRRFSFDEIILAPGTGVRDEQIVGLDAIARHTWPAAWGSAREARRLVSQLMAMRDGAHVVLRLPAGDVSHPSGLAHRSVEIADLLARTKPRSKLTVLDAGSASQAKKVFDSIAKNASSTRLIEWLGPEEGGLVVAVDVAQGRLETSRGVMKADVVNFVTAQRAGEIANKSGLVDKTGWCPCGADQRSLINSNAIVVGDATLLAQRTVKGAQKSGVAAAMWLTGA